MTLLLGLDIGSTIVKATVFDLRGRVVATAGQPAAGRHPEPGRVERDPERTWHTVTAVLQRVANGRGADIAAIGVTGCGNGAVFLDRHKRPVMPGILSTDTRAVRVIKKVRAAHGQRPYPGQLPVLLRWLRATKGSASRRMVHALFWKDYVRFRLTDVLATDYTDAGAAGLLDFPSHELRHPEPSLPEIRASLARAGIVTRSAAAVTNLTIGTPVFVGCIDCEAAAIGSGVRRPGDTSVVAGTWSINQSYALTPPRGSRHFLVNVSAIPNRWLVLEASARSAGNFDWARKALGVDLPQATREAAHATHSDLLFLPSVPTSAGAFVGLGPLHGRGELFRAVMEGVVFAHRFHLDMLARSVGPTKRLCLSGGAATNRFWCQLFADGLGCTVHVPRCVEVGTLGAAICAGVGAGYFASVPAAQKSMVSGYRVYHANPARHEALTRSYRRYLRLTQLVEN
jgi:L-xylulokinase